MIQRWARLGTAFAKRNGLRSWAPWNFTETRWMPKFNNAGQRYAPSSFWANFSRKSWRNSRFCRGNICSVCHKLGFTMFHTEKLRETQLKFRLFGNIAPWCHEFKAELDQSRDIKILAQINQMGVSICWMDKHPWLNQWPWTWKAKP